MPTQTDQLSAKLGKQKRRSRIEAKLLDGSAENTHARYGEVKAAAIGTMSGTVVELGPGTGVNMRYYAPGTRLIGYEPNPLMHEWLRPAADDAGVDLDIRDISAEGLDLDDNSVDGVVGTRVLCGVLDVAAVLSEIRRVLKPSGTYFFIEHVVAPGQGAVRQVQRIVKHPHRWMFNGCEPDRDLAASIKAAGFASVEMTTQDQGASALWVRHHIVGTAVNQ